MKKQKIVAPFSFNNLSNQDMVDMLNSSHPINLKYNEDLVNKVHIRYPIIDKSKVAIIIKAVFQSFRELLILGKVLNFNGLFFDTKFLFFAHRKNGVIFPALKVCISTPPPLKK
jgi:hypothetical protein